MSAADQPLAGAFALLHNHCQKRQLRLDQRFHEEPSRPRQWQCSLQVSGMGRSWQVASKGASKNEAKRLAAQMILPTVVSETSSRKRSAAAKPTPEALTASDKETDLTSMFMIKTEEAKKSTGRDFFQSVESLGLLERVFPLEKLMLGMRVCKWMECTLPKYAQAIVLQPLACVALDALRRAVDSGSIQLVSLEFSQQYPRDTSSLERAVKSCINLTSLNISANDLSWSTISKTVGACSTNLTSLNIGYNNAPGRDDKKQIEAVAKHVSALPLLCDLDLSGLKFRAEGKQLPTLLRACSQLTRLRLRDAIDRGIMGFLEQEFARLHALTDLDVRGSDMRAEGIEVLVRALWNHPSVIRRLDVGGSRMSSIGAGRLAELLIRNQRVGATRNSTSTAMGNETSSATTTNALTSSNNPAMSSSNSNHSSHKSLMELRLSSGQFTADGLLDLAPACNHIQAIDLADSSGCCNFYQTLSCLLPRWRSLTCLDMSRNRFSTSSAVYMLTKCLKASRALRHLALVQCGITASDLETIAASFRFCSRLEYLDLSGNPTGFGVNCGLICAAELGNFRNLQVLLLAGNSIQDEGATALADILKQGSFALALKTLGLCGNRIGPSGVRAIAEQIGNCAAFRTLSLRENPIEVQGLEALVEAIGPIKAFPPVRVLIQGCPELQEHIVGEYHESESQRAMTDSDCVGLSSSGLDLDLESTLVERCCHRRV